MSAAMSLLLSSIGCLALIASAVTIDTDSVELCSSPLGSLSLTRSSSLVAAAPSSAAPSSPTMVFLDSGPEFGFECASTDPTLSLELEFKRVRGKDAVGEDGIVRASLEAADMTHVNAVNRANTTATCRTSVNRHTVCQVILKVLHMHEAPSCVVNGNGTLDCAAAALQTDWERGGQERTLVPLGKETPKNDVVTYSFFDGAGGGGWVRCQEVDAEGVVVGVSTFAANGTQTIRCPIKLEGGPRPVIIRIEESTKSTVGAALPIFGVGDKPKYTYFSVFVNSTLLIDQGEFGGDQEEKTFFVLAAGMALLLVALVLVICALVTVGLKRRRDRLRKEAKSSFYADLDMAEKNSSAASMATDTTYLYEKFLRDIDTADLLKLFSEDELDPSNSNNKAPWEYMDKAKWNNLLRRQLSGDPTKINPELSLNQQVSALAYNPRLEIDRSNFTVGSMLGSGHFGSVYVGEATGIFHAGSKTTVAIKTVNNELDMAQMTSLFCEMKILTNLDLHLNLVSLLGSCTGQMDDGRLWLLLEYCPHGDLKSFLVQNRGQLKNSLTGLVATDYDSRLLLKWSHSIAKGMEYLSGKKIMHGDLAARNILLGEQLTAKVGDFGLSKSMYYDNIRYKKINRKYVPWKWMALEYLNDGCFTLKSDVWSYGVVLWETLSLGQEPYAGRAYEEAVKHLRGGGRLEMPEEAEGVDWAERLYKEVILGMCWESEAGDRASFADVVAELESSRFMDSEELREYGRLAGQNEGMRKLMLDEARLSKRNTLTPTTSVAFDAALPPGSYQKMVPQDSSAATPPQGGYITVAEAKSSDDPADKSGYLQMNSSMEEAEHVEKEEPPQRGYVALSSLAAETPPVSNGGYVKMPEEWGGGGVPLKSISEDTGYLSVGQAKSMEESQQEGNASNCVRTTQAKA